MFCMDTQPLSGYIHVTGESVAQPDDPLHNRVGTAGTTMYCAHKPMINFVPAEIARKTVITHDASLSSSCNSI